MRPILWVTGAVLFLGIALSIVLDYPARSPMTHAVIDVKPDITAYELAKLMMWVAPNTASVNSHHADRMLADPGTARHLRVIMNKDGSTP